MYDKPSAWRCLFLVFACDFIALTRIQFGAMAWLDLALAYCIKSYLLMYFPYTLPHLYLTWLAGLAIIAHGFETYFSPPLPKRYPGHVPIPYLHEFLLSVAVGLLIWWYPVKVVDFKPVTALIGYPNPFGDFSGFFLGLVASLSEDVTKPLLLNVLVSLIPVGMMLYDICERNEAPGGRPEREPQAMSFPEAQ